MAGFIRRNFYYLKEKKKKSRRDRTVDHKVEYGMLNLGTDTADISGMGNDGSCLFSLRRLVGW